MSPTKEVKAHQITVGQKLILDALGHAFVVKAVQTHPVSRGIILTARNTHTGGVEEFRVSRDSDLTVQGTGGVKKIRRKSLHLSLSLDAIAVLDATAKRWGATRSEMIERWALGDRDVCDTES